MSIYVERNLCPQNHICPVVRMCPVDAVKQNGFEAPRIDNLICIDCGKCSKICPTGALKYTERGGKDET
ncbi:MAG: 4Fe-4S binding protein [Chitinispirillaceae bacterium]